MPRPVLLTDTLRAVILAETRAGRPLADAARAAGVSRGSCVRWQHVDPAFADALRAAREVARPLTPAKVPPTPPAAPKVAPSKVERPARRAEHDTRTPVSAEQVEAALRASGKAIGAALANALRPKGPPRFANHEGYGRLRAAFHVLPDGLRRETAVRLMLEEVARLDGDDAASLNRRSREREASP